MKLLIETGGGTRRNPRGGDFMKLTTIRNILLSLYLALGAWIFISWVDVAIHSLDTYPVYYAWNFFTLFF